MTAFAVLNGEVNFKPKLNIFVRYLKIVNAFFEKKYTKQTNKQTKQNKTKQKVGILKQIFWEIQNIGRPSGSWIIDQRS